MILAEQQFNFFRCHRWTLNWSIVHHSFVWTFRIFRQFGTLVLAVERKRLLISLLSYCARKVVFLPRFFYKWAVIETYESRTWFVSQQDIANLATSCNGLVELTNATDCRHHLRSGFDVATYSLIHIWISYIKVTLNSGLSVFRIVDKQLGALSIAHHIFKRFSNRSFGLVPFVLRQIVQEWIRANLRRITLYLFVKLQTRSICYDISSFNLFNRIRWNTSFLCKESLYFILLEPINDTIDILLWYISFLQGELHFTIFVGLWCSKLYISCFH